MKTIKILQTRLQELESEVLQIIDNQMISMTKKNTIMEPLVDEKRAILKCIDELRIIQNKNYTGKCVY